MSGRGRRYVSASEQQRILGVNDDEWHDLRKAIREYREEKFGRQSWSTILWTDRKQLYDGFLDSDYGRYFKNTDGSSNAEKHSVLKYLFSNVNFGKRRKGEVENSSDNVTLVAGKTTSESEEPFLRQEVAGKHRGDYEEQQGIASSDQSLNHNFYDPVKDH
ncbi:hypothetical protein VTN00DRAFT_2730 [Thermoascus crustaceus]|uniref:uncharacterized protein n=1 Tax=Thermoascus crustaceus TaxID=5088 RepID=UPI003742B2A4